MGRNVDTKHAYRRKNTMNTFFISTKQIKDLVNEQKFTSTQDIMECMKGMFADVLEQVLQAEMDQHLGYDHCERTSCDGRKNYRKWHCETHDENTVGRSGCERTT